MSGERVELKCPECSSSNILYISILPIAGRAERHIRTPEGIVSEDVTWDDDFDEPPMGSTYWCEICRRYIDPDMVPAGG